MPRLPIIVDGDCDSRFDRVKQVFHNNFTQRWESEGAAFAVYFEGEKVVDLWGGYADSSSYRKWKSDTMTLLFSCTKSICAVCFAMLVDRGLVAYKDLVTKYWPEFGQNNKENITIETLLSHQGGLAYVDNMIEESDIRDWRRMSKIFEDQKPNWTPGQEVGYHAITFGWLVDQLVRRIDPEKRSVSQFFKEEIAEPHNLDLIIGAPVELEHRIARLVLGPKFLAAREVIEYPILLKVFWNGLFMPINLGNRMLRNVQQNISWMGSSAVLFNNPDIRSLDIPAATGMGTARSLAKLHSLVLEGKLLKATSVEQLFLNPVVCNQMDSVLSTNVSFGKGFTYTKNFQDQWLVGHPGIGGQNVKMDSANGVAFAYLCNGLKVGHSDLTVTFMRLQNALYECLRENNLLKEIPEEKTKERSKTVAERKSSLNTSSKNFQEVDVSTPLENNTIVASDT
uniref:Beta-lactamase domain-containing protein n=1 Tax=Elaeophora elaphi TaxID=1147741 RepID=A0A0R3RPU1_9BILA